MMQVRTCALDSVRDEKLAFAVVGARQGGRWIFVRRRDLSTGEIPGEKPPGPLTYPSIQPLLLEALRSFREKGGGQTE